MIENLPAHALLVHFIVVLVPLTAILLILCAVWPAARERLTWLVAALAAFILVLTPITIKAGEWLADREAIQQGAPADQLNAHMDAGDTGFYLALAIAVAAGLLVFLHIRLRGEHALGPAGQWGIAAVIILIAFGSMFQIHKIGQSGAEVAWSWVCPSGPSSC